MTVFNVLLLVFMFRRNWCLTDVYFNVSTAVRSGCDITLNCSFTLQQDHIYSVKFYLEDTEFYRYVPKESPPTRIFPFSGISVNLLRYSENSSTVILSRVHRDMTGVYKCEVTGDAPLFQTVIKTSHVTVVEEPEGLPKITTDNHRYQPGEPVTATCSSTGGHPPPHLTWFLNGQQVMSTNSCCKLVDVQGENRDIRQLRLSLVTGLTDRRTGPTDCDALRLRCVATQFTLYHGASDLVLLQESHPYKSVLKRRPPAHSGTWKRTKDDLASLILLVMNFMATFCHCTLRT